MPVAELLTLLAASLGTEHVLSREQTRRRYPTETAFSPVELEGALCPRTVDEVADCVRVAHRTGTPLYTISTGNNWGYGAAAPPRPGCVLLDLGRLNRVRDFDAQSGIATLEPGVTQASLHDFLAKGGHRYLVPVTGAGPTCSIVGNALERGYGITPWVDHFYAVTGIEAVLPDGTLYRSPLAAMGAQQVAGLFKWGIGPYLDGIFTQSGFGVVTAMSVALARQSEGMECFLFSLTDEAKLPAAVEATRDILSSLPGLVGGINLMNRLRVLAMSIPYPKDRLGADGLIPEAYLAEMGRRLQIFPWTGYGTLYGTRRTVKAARAEIRQRLRGIATRLLFISPERAGQLVRAVNLLPGALHARFAPAVETLSKSLELVTGKPNQTALPLAYWRSGRVSDPQLLNPARDGCGLAWFAPLVPIKAEAVREYVTFTTTTMRHHRLEPLITLTAVNDRCFDSTVPLLFDPSVPEEVQRTREAHRRLLDEALAHGLAPYRVGADSMEWLRGTAPGHWDLVARLKKTLDPEGILAPGRYTT